MLGVAIGMFCAVAAFFSYLSPQSRRRLVGYGLWVDAAVWALFLTLFGGTGAERLGAIFASMGVTAFIHSYRRLFGYEKFIRGKWVRFTGLIRTRG